MDGSPHKIPKKLYVRFAIVCLIYFAVIGKTYVWLQAVWPYANRWLASSTAVALFLLALLFFQLSENYRANEGIVLPTLGLGNSMTLIRGLLLSMIAGFLFTPWAGGLIGWLPALFYTVATLLDFGDGLAARLTNHSTRLGEILDMELDSLGVGIICLLGVLYGQVGWWYLLLAVSRYWFVAGMWWRERNGRPIYDLSHSRYRRLIAGYNMGFLTVLLWPIVSTEVAVWGAIVFLAPTLAIFLRDWLVVSGRLDPSEPCYVAWRNKVVYFGSQWLPIVMRVIIMVTAVTTGVIAIVSTNHPSWRAMIGSWGWSSAWVIGSDYFLSWLALITLACVVAGVWARWMALVAILPVSVNLVALGGPLLNVDDALLAAAIYVIAILNSGKWSLRKPPEEYIYVPIGSTNKTP